VQQLLTLARLDPDHGLTESLPVRLDEVLRLAHHDLTPIAQDKNIELRLGPTFPHEISGHADAISILLRNLIDNAIRYTPANGIVEISLVRSGDTVALRVADSGPGIPEDEREKVFKRFYRRLGTEAPGSGLGLSIVQRIAELHRAQISLGTSTHGGLQVDVIFQAPETIGS
jgi:signal transduction histidine kinase